MKWVEKINGKVYILFPSLGRYVTYSRWKKMALKLGKEPFGLNK